MQQTQPQEVAVDCVAADCPEPAQLPQCPRATHHPWGLLGWEWEVRVPNTPEQVANAVRYQNMPEQDANAIEYQNTPEQYSYTVRYDTI